MRTFQRISLATAILTYALIVVGGVVRVTGSGLGCPDWPLCHGNVVPAARVDAIIEYSHRFVAGIVTLLTVATLAICIVFFPVFLLEGAARFLFIPLGITVVLAMLASYVLSFTVVPTMATNSRGLMYSEMLCMMTRFLLTTRERSSASTRMLPSSDVAATRPPAMVNS